MPKISVIIPTYQSIQFIRETIESVLAQTYRNYEIIVVDGGSTDGTKELLNSYEDRINVIVQKGKGISNARNVGVRASNGEYIAFVDSDDLWLPKKLEIQMKFFNEKSFKVGLIYSDAFFFPEEKNLKFDSLANKRAFQIGKPHRGRILKHLLMENFIPASTVLIRKLCFERVGLFDESLRLCEDIDMWMRIAESFEVDYQDVVLAKIRLRTGSLTQDREQLFRSQMAHRKKILRRIPHILREFDSKDMRRRQYRFYLLLGTEQLLKCELKNAKQNFEEYIKLYPYNIGAYFLLLLTYFPFSLSNKFRLYKYLPKCLTQRVYNNFSR